MNLAIPGDESIEVLPNAPSSDSAFDVTGSGGAAQFCCKKE